ncbi:MAG: hypothetical protein QOG34_942 [Frankiaceae bacterium]|nr:hypothetical protein [Frankiaceae bacterium]
MATHAFARRLGVVTSSTVLAIAALGGVASASPGNGNGAANGAANGAGNGNGAAQSAAHANANSGKANAADSSASGAAGSHSTDGTAGTSGDPSQPQPVSTADANTGGANGQCPGGPYCSTRDGSPSGNGNGGGKATGKPCAGCVGKSDNKNPKGQMPGGSDHNAGYECDRNHGIGRSNPAHTGCTTPTTVTTCPSGQVMVAGTCTTPATDTTCPSGQVMVAGTCTTPGTDTTCPSGQVMVAGTCTTPGTENTCPAGEEMANGACVLGTSFTRHPAVHVPATVLGERVVRAAQVSASATSLPFTGVPTGELLLLAAAALTAGGALTVAGRRRLG